MKRNVVIDVRYENGLKTAMGSHTVILKDGIPAGQDKRKSGKSGSRN
jgi:hypothetical protein